MNEYIFGDEAATRLGFFIGILDNKSPAKIVISILAYPI